MKVRMVVEISGTRNNGQDWPKLGGEIDLPDDEAQALVDGGMAVPATKDKVEKAVADDTAVEKRAGLTTKSGAAK